jgi:hypothetical protein
MKKIYVFVLLLASFGWCFAQTNVSKRYDIKSTQQIKLKFDDANIINIAGWNEDYISIVASVRINNNQHNDAFQFEENTGNGTKSITGFIKDKNRLPKVISIKKGDEIFTFNTDDWDSPEIQKFYSEHGKEGIEWTSHGISRDINLTIKLPQRSDVMITSKHGIIELENMLGKVEANSTHGGIDVFVNDNMHGELDAKTKWGTIYSNIDLKIDKELSSNKDWNIIIATINSGDGAPIKLESRHANIYLRRK